MKKKISRIMGVGLAVVIVTSLLIAVLPVSAGTLSWGSETIPSTTSKVIEADTINDIAIGPDGTTIYAALTTNKLYKSTDAGKTWSALTSPAAGTADLVAVAPDDVDLLGVVDVTNDTVYISTNGGSTFSTLGVPADGSSLAVQVIYDIAISRQLSGVNYVAVGGEDAAGASLHYFNYGAAAPSWRDAADGTDWTSAIGNSADEVRAVAFSPNFPSDRIIMAVTWDAAGATLDFQAGSFAATDWNNGVGGYSASYPVSIETAGITGVTAASISVDANYLGSDEATRIVFVGTTVTGTSTDTPGGIYRLDDTSVTDLKTGTAIQSVAYNTAATKLVAGASADNNAYRSADPTASSPTVSSASTYKRSGDNANTTTVIVGWSGDNVLAGSAGTDGAFSVSTDDGKTFNDISLVNSAMTNIGDVAVSPDGSMIYLVADDTDDVSLWRYASSWQRVFTIDAASVTFIVRPAPDDFDVVYLARTGSNNIYYTDDAGEAKWTLRYCGVTVQDLAIESAEILYAATQTAATVAKSDNGGFIWDSAEATGNGGNNHMIKSLGEDLLVLGSVDGFVAYSDDANDSWTAISTVTPGTTPALTQVTASGLADGDFIYAATSETGDNIYRYEIGDGTWKDIISGTTTTAATDAPVSAAMGVYGLALDNGVLYALASDGTDSGLWRTLSPSTASSTSTWSYKLTTDADNVALDNGPQALRVSIGSTKLWAIKTNVTDKLYSFDDTTAVEVPVLAAPRDGFSVAMNPQTGRALDVAFNWDRLSESTSYNLEIALDPDFDQLVRTETVASTASKVVQILGPFTAGPSTNTLEWMAGETYYWRVRASSNGPLYSNYSAVNSFTVEEAAEQLPPVIIEQGPAPVIEVPTIQMPPITVTIPDIILPTPAAVPDIVIPQAPVAPAPITPAYIWAIVIIGAILVIAVVVLIVRTRRPV